MSPYDGNSDSIEDPEIGTVKMYIKWAGADQEEATDDVLLGFREIKTK